MKDAVLSSDKFAHFGAYYLYVVVVGFFLGYGFAFISALGLAVLWELAEGMIKKPIAIDWPIVVKLYGEPFVVGGDVKFSVLDLAWSALGAAMPILTGGFPY